MYSNTLLEHFQNPRNVGAMDDADFVGEAGSAECGDTTTVYLKISGDVITDITFLTFGCATAIASSSVLTEIVKGKTIKEAMALSKNDIAEALDGVPEEKMHCSLLAEDALKAALKKALPPIPMKIF